MRQQGLRKGLAGARKGPGFWALVDQGTVSLGTFATTLVLARDLPAAEFGVFGILMGLLVTAVTVHTSLIGVPLMVLTAKSTHRRQLPALALGVAAVSTGLFAVVLVVAVIILGRPGLLPWIALALLGAEVQETLRRSLMGRLEFRRAVAGDAVSYFGQAVAIAVLASSGRATVAEAFGIMGISSLAAAALQVWQVRPSFEASAFRPDTIRPFWRLGGALVVVNGVGAIALQSLVWALGVLQGVSAVGSFQALLTVVGPTNPLMLAANNLVTTGVAHIHEPDPVRKHQRELAVARRYGLMVGVPVLLYCGALLAVPEAVLTLFFGSRSVYLGLTGELRLFVLFSLGHYLYFVAAGVMNARQDTSTLLRAQLASALAVPLGVPLTAVWSVGGTVVATVLSALTRMTIALARCRTSDL